jgi:hypothetical protein
MKNSIIICFFIFPFLMFSQQSKDTVKENEKNKVAAVKWLKHLNENGIEVKGDSVFVSNEYEKVLNNEQYRFFIYPVNYSWKKVNALIKKMQLKIAFWHLINLYSGNDASKELVLKSLLMFDKVLSVGEALPAAFNTYIYLDPEVSILKDGDSQITRPDILEEKLRNLNEILSYIEQYKETKKNN